MNKNVFNTLLASVVAGAMTMGVASFAGEKKAEKKDAKAAATKTDKKAAKGEEHKCGEGSCGEKKGEHKDEHKEDHH